MPEMNYIYEKQPDPITLDIYPDTKRASSYILYDRQSPAQSPVVQTAIRCVPVDDGIEITIGPSPHNFELWVHCAKEPSSVTADSKPLPRLQAKTDYDKSTTGWYYGPGCFYGNDKIPTANIKLAASAGKHRVRLIR